MELTEQQKQTVLDILALADGEDVDEIVSKSSFKEYLTHSLIMSAKQEELEYSIQERKELSTI